MPSLVEGQDRETVKRVVPKASNKIHAVGIAKLYVAHPDRSRWTFTGLQGAAVLANDLVGNTFWLKLVDVSPANRGVIWDQEIYDTFQYNQDRVFFHTFELEDCLAAFSFADDKEARKFKQKMDEREKNAHKHTKARPFGSMAGTGGDGATAASAGDGHHSRLGRLGGFLHRDRASSGAGMQPSQSIIPPREVQITRTAKDEALENIPPHLLQELKEMGLTEDQLAENADFIKMYIEQKAAEEGVSQRPRPPAPPAPITPQDTGASRRGPAPAPPPARRSGAAPPTPDSPQAQATPSPPPAAASRFKAPPPLADAGKFANIAPVSRNRSSSNAAQTGPPPPPRPPKTPMDEDDGDAPRFGVPPPFQGERAAPLPPPRSTGFPPTPARGAVPPPPPARDSSGPVHMMPPPPSAVQQAPPLPPKAPQSPPSSHSALPPPPPPARDTRAVPPPPVRGSVPPPPPPQSVGGPPPPPPLPASSGGPPPPPPMPSSGGPPPPPPMPGQAAATPALPKPVPGRDGLLGEIRGGAKLKKVSEADKRDRSAAAVPGGATPAPAAGAAPGQAGGDQGGLAGALASALAARKSKVSQSDDEDDKDDW